MSHKYVNNSPAQQHQRESDSSASKNPINVGRANRQKERTDASINVNELSTYSGSEAARIDSLKVLGVCAEMQAIYRFHLWSAYMLQEVIAFVYTANGVLVSLVYLPQLHTVWNDRTGARAGSLLTWSLFSLSSVVALLYGVLVLHDGRMVFAAGSSTAGSLSVLGTAVYRRQQAKRQR